METQTDKKYELTGEMKSKFISLVLINEIINFQHYFPVDAQDDNVFLNKYLQEMESHGLLQVKNDKYIPTAKGREYLVNFYAKYFEFLKVFDIYCAVDLKEGQFAFAEMFNDDMNDEQWKDFLCEERFSDVRVAVAEFKKINPVEIVFMSFLNENKFDCTKERWQVALTKNDVWNEIIEICNSAISLEYLLENDVIQDVIKQGSALMLDLYKEKDERDAQRQEEEDANNQQDEEVVEETIEEYVEIVEPPYYPYSYFNPYMDIYYVSPIWVTPFLW